METLIPMPLRTRTQELIALAKADPKAELEMKVLSGSLQTKDVADRIVKAIDDITRDILYPMG